MAKRKRVAKPFVDEYVMRDGRRIYLLGEGPQRDLWNGGKSIFFGEPPVPLVAADGSANFLGVTWEYRDGSPGQWYLHAFTPEQPDMNWSNPDIVDHFASRIAPIGLKAQVVCYDRELCVLYQKEIQRLLDKQGEGWQANYVRVRTVFASKGKGEKITAMHCRCLPDTVDPRAPKAGGR